MAETKVTSIRADEETTLRFKELSEQYPNSAECLKALINAHEMAQAKGVLVGQETNINDFQSHLDSIMRGYITALDMTANAENRIREEFRANLDSKDKIILNLQESLDVAEQNVTSIEEEKKAIEIETEEQKQEFINEIAILSSKLEQAEQAQRTAEQTVSVAQTAADTQKLIISTLEEKLNEANETIKSKTSIADEAVKQLDELRQRAEAAEKELTAQKEQAALTAERAALELEKAVLSEQRKAAEAAIKQADEIKTLYSEIQRLKDEITKLSSPKNTKKEK